MCPTFLFYLDCLVLQAAQMIATCERRVTRQILILIWILVLNMICIRSLFWTLLPPWGMIYICYVCLFHLKAILEKKKKKNHMSLSNLCWSDHLGLALPTMLTEKESFKLGSAALLGVLQPLFINGEKCFLLFLLQKNKLRGNRLWN